MGYLPEIISMKIVYYNIQGAKKTQAAGEIRVIKKKLNPNILIIAETMTNQVNTERIILGFDEFIFTNPENHQGEL